MNYKHYIMTAVVGIVLIITYSFFVYPTQYHYQKMEVEGPEGYEITQHTRTNNFTGAVEIYSYSNGWVLWQAGN